MKTAKYFSATWCQPCKTFKPIMMSVANSGYSVEFIDIDVQPNLASQFQVRSIPTVLIFEHGIQVDRLTGVHTIQQVLDRMK